MDSGSLTQIHAPFNQAPGMGMPSGLASRRGGAQNIKPLSFDALKSASGVDNGLPTPRTARSHLLAGLRTAPKSATVSSFSTLPSSPTTAAPQGRNRNSMIGGGGGLYDATNLYNNPPKTSLPRFASQQPQLQPQAQAYNPMMGFAQQYTTDQVLAPPQINLDDAAREGTIDPALHAQLLYTNAYLTEQQQRLQQQLRALQEAAQQFQNMNLNGQSQMMQQQMYPSVYQQQLQNTQAMMAPTAPHQANMYGVYNPAASQQSLYMDQTTQSQLNAQLTAQLNAQLHAQLNAQIQANQAQLVSAYAALQQQQQQAQQAQQQQAQQAAIGTPRVQVSPPPASANNNRPGFRVPTPPRCFDSPSESASNLTQQNAARRPGHKKTPSGGKTQLMISVNDEPLKSAAPKTAVFPLTSMTSSYGPGQARAGEHPIRQPRNPPSLDELRSKPTAKHEGSKNFVARTRRSAVHNLVRAGLERRKEARSSGSGSTSPTSETTEEAIQTPLTDNDSDSVRSGSGSLIDRDDCMLPPSARSSTSSWGAIGSDRPSSRQKAERKNSAENVSLTPDNEGSREQAESFAALLKNRGGSDKAGAGAGVEGQRKAPRLVLTSAEKRKAAAAAAGAV